MIQKNLSFCFQDYGADDLKQLETDAYKNFVDIILESLKGLGTNARSLIPRYEFTNPELLNEYYDKGQHLILYSQHLNNWEWAPLCLGLQMKHELVGVIKTISNHHIDAFMERGRSGNNVQVVPTFRAAEYFNKLNAVTEPKAMVFIADQRPYGNTKSLELDFMNKSSLWHHGAALLACRTNYPVYTIDVIRVGRSRYQVSTTLIVEDASTLSPADLTKKYKDHVEHLVNKNKASWLWSHKRFKESIKY